MASIRSQRWRLARVPAAVPALALVLVLSGCAGGVSGLRSTPEGAFVVSVSASRVMSSVVEPIDEALAEARFKCWSDRKGVAVLSRRVDAAAGAMGLQRSATLTFVCAGEHGAS